MGENTKISWCDHTFSPWWGCTKVSAGCANCYAEVMAARFGIGWGKDAPRRFFGEKHWNEPIKWNRAAEKTGTRAHVFCASMADVFEHHPELEVWRLRLWRLINATPWLDWLLLTKRPESARGLWFPTGCEPRNLWLGCTVEDRVALSRLGDLRETPAVVRFLSCEPLLEDLGPIDLTGIDWVIVGGESGPKARPCRVDWIRSIVEQCDGAGVKCFVKQLGSVAGVTSGAQHPGARTRMHVCGYQETLCYAFRDRAGSDPAEWPDDLRIRQFPEVKP